MLNAVRSDRPADLVAGVAEPFREADDRGNGNGRSSGRRKGKAGQGKVTLSTRTARSAPGGKRLRHQVEITTMNGQQRQSQNNKASTVYYPALIDTGLPP